MASVLYAGAIAILHQQKKNYRVLLVAIKIRQQKQTQFLESMRTLVPQVSKGPLLPNYNNLLNTNKKQKIINTKERQQQQVAV